jgi:hypothetical protein
MPDKSSRRAANRPPVSADPDAPPLPHASGIIAVPRRWLIALLLLVMAPWIVMGVMSVARSETPASVEHEDPAPSSTTATGPWGRLSITPLIVSPPIEYVSTQFGPVEPPVWRLPHVTADDLTAFLISKGMARSDVDSIVATARPEPAIKGVVVSPDPGLLRRLDPALRSRVYVTLSRTTQNPAHAHSYRFLGRTAEDWLGGASIASRTRALVEPLIYTNEEFLHFADLDLIRSELDEAELLRLVKVLNRHATVAVSLSIDDPAQIAPVAEYWGRGGRRTDIRPLLESIASRGPGRSIDIVHLLPAFARDHLYRYPRITAADLDRPVIANCLWTALNFFRPQPDDRFLDVPYALDTLRRDYYIIEQNYQLGDIVAFLDREGNIFHAAVYLAGNLVFSKNGTSPLAPWTIMSIDQVEGYYDTRAEEPQRIFHRRKDL